MKFKNKVKRIEYLTRESKRAVQKLLSGNISDGQLWVLYHGFLGGIYSLQNEINKLDDARFKDCLLEWKDLGRLGRLNQKLDELKELGRKSAHHGAFSSGSQINWENDIVNDTEHPVKRRTVTISGKSDDRVSIEVFREKVMDCLDAIILEIDWIKDKAGITVDKTEVGRFHPDKLFEN
jgi:hypothetical protein